MPGKSPAVQPVKPLPPLPPRQAAYAREYLVDLNGTQAAIRAGYSPKAAEIASCRLMRNARIKDLISVGMAERAHRTEVTADRVVDELAKLAFANLADFVIRGPDDSVSLDIKHATRAQMAAVTEIVTDTITENGKTTTRTKLKLADKRGALELLGRHLDMFRQRLEVTASVVDTTALRESILGRLAEMSDRLAPGTIEHDPADE